MLSRLNNSCVRDSPSVRQPERAAQLLNAQATNLDILDVRNLLERQRIT